MLTDRDIMTMSKKQKEVMPLEPSGRCPCAGSIFERLMNIIPSPQEKEVMFIACFREMG